MSSPATADLVLYETSFEASEGFTADAAPSGWTLDAPENTNIWVTGSHAVSGTQSLTFQDRSGSAGRMVPLDLEGNLVRASVDVSGVVDNTVSASFHFKSHPDTTADLWDEAAAPNGWPAGTMPTIFLNDSSGGRLWDMSFYNANRINIRHLDAAGTLTSMGVSNSLIGFDFVGGAEFQGTLTYDGNTGAKSLVLTDGVTVTTHNWTSPTGLVVDGVTFGLETGRGGGFGSRTSADWAELAYLDDVRISTVPEPASLGLLSVGGAMLLLRRKWA